MKAPVASAAPMPAREPPAEREHGGDDQHAAGRPSVRRALAEEEDRAATESTGPCRGRADRRRRGRRRVAALEAAK